MKGILHSVELVFEEHVYDDPAIDNTFSPALAHQRIGDPRVTTWCPECPTCQEAAFQNQTFVEAQAEAVRDAQQP